MVGGDEQQVVLSEGGGQGRQRRVEVAQSLIEPRNIVPVPVQLVEIYKVAEQQPIGTLHQPL
ncbi:hypothetical protein D3C83_301740 [compost metagenome]